MRRTALAKKKSKSNGSSPRKKGPAGSQYVVCVKNDDYPDDYFVAIRLTPTVERALRSAS